MRINSVQTVRFRTSNRPSAGWRRLKANLRGWYQVVSFNLASCYRSHGTAGCLVPAAEPPAVCLCSNEVIRLTEVSGFQQVEVRSGTIWLTGTPAKGDVLLRPGERFHLTHDWPFVLQAMNDARIILRS